MTRYDSQPKQHCTTTTDLFRLFPKQVLLFDRGIRSDWCYTFSAPPSRIARMRIVFNRRFPIALHPYESGRFAHCLIFTTITDTHPESVVVVRILDMVQKKGFISIVSVCTPRSIMDDEDPPPHTVDPFFFIEKLRFDVIASYRKPPIQALLPEVPSSKASPIVAIKYSAHLILFPTPKEFTVLENSIQRQQPFTFLDLRRVLAKGPLYVDGSNPEALQDKQLKLTQHKITQLEVTPWNAEDAYKHYRGGEQLFLLGTQKKAEQTLIYFTGAQGYYVDLTTHISTYTPCTVLNKLYCTSLAAFNRFYTNTYSSLQAFPVFTEQGTHILPSLSTLSRKERKYREI